MADLASQSRWFTRFPYSPPAADDPHGPEYVRDETPKEGTEIAAQVARALAPHGRLLHRIAELAEQSNTPPRLIDPYPALAANAWTATDFSKEQSKGLGVLNVANVNVYVGFDSGQATAAARSFAIPATSMVVLPFGYWDVTFGIDPTDQAAVGTNTVVVYAWRYQHVPPAFMGPA